jgi:hypothetical protein
MTTSNPAGTRSDFEPYTDEALLDPWPGYRELLGAGPAVWLPQYEKFALMRYAAVRARAGDWKSFQCGYGVMMNDQMSQLVRGNTLCSDGAEHDALRGVIVRP